MHGNGSHTRRGCCRKEDRKMSLVLGGGGWRLDIKFAPRGFYFLKLRGVSLISPP